MTPTFSVITPTIGRASLRLMLEDLGPQLKDGDEVLVLGDGPQPAAADIVRQIRSLRVSYQETAARGLWGNPQRNEGIRKATGSHLFFVDDDDRVLDGALRVLRAVLQKAPGRPHMFRMQHPQVVLWQQKQVRPGNISGQMFVVPNVKGKVGLWSDRYEADQDFVRSTLDLHGGEKNLIWREEVLVVQGLAGKGAGR